MKKISRAAILIVSLFGASLSFAQTTTIAPAVEDVYSFSNTAGTVVVAPAEEIETNKVAVNTDTTASSEDTLLADAQTIIKDNLIEKYQVRLDKIMEQISKNLTGVPAEVQRQKLGEVQGRIVDKKAIVMARSNIDPMKRDITIAVLDYIILRIEGMIQQSAQTAATTPV